MLQAMSTSAPLPSLVVRLTPKEVEVLTDIGRQVSRRGKSDPGVRQVLHAWVRALQESDLKVRAIKEVIGFLESDDARPRKHLRTTKKVKSAPAKEQKAQASPPASQSNGLVRRQVVGVPAPGRSRPPVRPVAPKEPEPAEELPKDSGA